MHPSLALVVALLAAVAPAPHPATTAKANPRVTLDTSKGKIVVELLADKTPKTVDNFLQYVKTGFYDGTIFHRVIAGFMIQGGGFEANGRQRTTRPPIPNESKSGVSNARGTIAMARTNDPDSATAQFFINVVDNSRLDTAGGGYTAFGKVVEGMDVADAIAAVPVARGTASDTQPVEPVLLRKATVN
jgi:cyclophilin family peptidyl-prolyl cis-trans isomerase